MAKARGGAIQEALRCVGRRYQQALFFRVTSSSSSLPPRCSTAGERVYGRAVPVPRCCCCRYAHAQVAAIRYAACSFARTFAAEAPTTRRALLRHAAAPEIGGFEADSRAIERGIFPASHCRTAPML